MKVVTKPALSLVLAWLLAFTALQAPGAQATTLGSAHHDATIALDPVKGTVKLDNTVTLEAAGQVTLRLNAAFVIEALAVNGVHRSANRQMDMLTVDLGTPGQHTITLKARASLAAKTAHEQPPFLSAEGGFLALDWLGNPRGHPATYRVQVETPLPQVAVMPGRIEDERRTGGVYRATFTSTVPDDAPVLITGPFNVAEKLSGDVRIRTYFHDELVPLADGYLTDAARYIEHYARQIGAFPHAGFAIVSGPVPIGIGLPGMTYMGRRVLALPFIRSTSLPHEVLHNWWGNGVFVDYVHGNWAEGLTTYQADHAQAASQNQDGGASKRLEWLRNYAALPPERDHPLTAFTSKTHDASQVLGYGKVGYVFHMLNVQLGADVFKRAIQRFYADNRMLYAGWEQIRAAFEAESGEDLGAFFDAWLTRTGAPELKLDDVAAQDDTISFTVTQLQDGEAYPLVLPIDVETSQGHQRLHARMTAKQQHFNFEAPARPLSVSVDPDFDVFRRLTSGEAPPIFRDVTLDDSTALVTPGAAPAVQGAARALAETLMQGSPDAPQGDGPLIVAGLEEDVLAYLAQNALPAPPPEVAAPAQAKAYVARTTEGRPVLAALARDASGMEALARVLGHYKRRSYVVMNEGAVTARGTWPAPPGPLTVRLDGR